MVYAHGSASAGKLELELRSLTMNAPLGIRDELLSPLYMSFVGYYLKLVIVISLLILLCTPLICQAR
jgi:hypothetical protein